MTTWQGADELADQLVEVDTLTPLPGNPRQGDVGAISQSLERFGQLKPIVVDGENIIIAGNHTYQAAVALGWTHIAALTPEHLNGKELAAFALADNRLSDLADYDNDALLEMLEGAYDEGGLTGTGYDTEDLDHLRRLIDGPLDLEGMEEKYPETPDDTSFWPKISVQVPTPVFQRWQTLIARSPKDNPHEQIAWVCEQLAEHLSET